MELLHKNYGIFRERMDFWIATISTFILTIGLIVISFFKLFVIIFALYVLFLNVICTLYLVSILKNTINYRVYLYMDYMIIETKNKKILVSYDKIEKMNWKKDVGIALKRMAVYLEIECGLECPVYLAIRPYVLPKIEKITNDNFAKNYLKVSKYNGAIVSRNKIVKY